MCFSVMYFYKIVNKLSYITGKNDKKPNGF
jgi:hypothetical protein